MQLGRSFDCACLEPNEYVSLGEGYRRVTFARLRHGRERVESVAMKTNCSFLTLFVAGALALVTINSSRAGSLVGFRDGSPNLARAATKLAGTGRATNSGPTLSRHGADDPANH